MPTDYHRIAGTSLERLAATPAASSSPLASAACRLPALYAVCLLIGMVSTYAAIALLVLLQLNSAIAPRIRPLDRF